ncbi:MAG: prolyl oligopeptidase family serine peptidase [Lachnospiraceae bacterium]|nr:prolyl oligopeptidase family serine peptidase [Lachnospiraceae bacterium]
MILPDDWDVPGEENEGLCRQFDEAIFQNAEVSIPYRWFAPGAQGIVPLVVYLHGADAVGNENRLPLSMHDIGTMFAREGWQRSHPCFILAPQYGRSMHWSIPAVSRGLMGLIEYMTASFPNIDRRRIYIYGYSAGGVGTLRMLKEYPGFFAGAISICGATSREGIEHLQRVPLWMVHALDDEIVKATYRDKYSSDLSHLGSKDLYLALKEGARDLHYTEFPAGYMKEHYGVHPHCSWVAVSDETNTEIKEWLFSR